MRSSSRRRLVAFIHSFIHPSIVGRPVDDEIVVLWRGFCGVRGEERRARGGGGGHDYDDNDGGWPIYHHPLSPHNMGWGVTREYIVIETRNKIVITAGPTWTAWAMAMTTGRGLGRGRRMRTRRTLGWCIWTTAGASRVRWFYFGGGRGIIYLCDEWTDRLSDLNQTALYPADGPRTSFF